MAAMHDNVEYIYSRFGADPDFGEIVGIFVEELPRRVSALLEHLNKGEWEDLRRIAHQVKGAAGSYGFEAVSPVAAKVEAAVRNQEPEEAIRLAIAELSDVVARVRGGAPSA
jgi:histidine phosphotransfer protein HptB